MSGKMRKITYILVLFTLTFAGCTNKGGSNSGLPSQKSAILQGSHDAELVGFALDLLDIVENYTVENFESQQRRGFGMLEEGFRRGAEQHLSKRIEDIRSWGFSQKFFPDEETILIESREHYKGVEARVTVQGEIEMVDKQGNKTVQDVEYKVTMVGDHVENLKATSWTVKNL